MRSNYMPLIFVGLLLATTIACDETQSKDVRYVTAGSGLVLRDKPNTGGQRVQLIQYGKPVEFVEEQATTETIGGKQGRWTRISYEGKSGWVFGAYLSQSAPGAEQTQCYSVTGETFAGKIKLRLFSETVKGNLQGTVHDEPNSYFTSYSSTINGSRSGETLEVDLVTEIELDTQNSSETWKLAGNTLTTATHTYFKVDCGAE